MNYYKDLSTKILENHKSNVLLNHLKKVSKNKEDSYISLHTGEKKLFFITIISVLYCLTWIYLLFIL